MFFYFFITFSEFKMCADYLKLYKIIKSYTNCALLQGDINNIQNRRLSFNPDKSLKMSL